LCAKCCVQSVDNFYNSPIKQQKNDSIDLCVAGEISWRSSQSRRIIRPARDDNALPAFRRRCLFVKAANPDRID